MNSRALLVVAAFVTALAWAQEHSFDPHSDTVKNIVRATAATQFATTTPVQYTRPTVEKPPPESRISEDALIAEKAPVKPKPSLPAPTRARDTFFSAMVDTLVESALDDWLGTDDDGPEWQGCRHVDPKATSLQYEVTPECMQSASYLP